VATSPTEARVAAVSASVLRVTVERDSSGNAIVEWRFDGPASGVDIAAGPTADPADHVAVLSAGPEQSSARIDHAPRCFVSVRAHNGGHFTIAAERRVVFEGLQNFRDLGGYASVGGRHTAWGQVYRSDSLHKLTPDDLVALDLMGVRTVYDLRGTTERETHPN